jgi:hypothetical protein
MNEYDINELDDSWIYEFEKIDKDYKHFYKENVTFLKLHCIYINKNNEIEKIKQDKIILKTPNTLSREEVVSIIKHNNVDANMKYSLLSILKYNISLEPIHLHHFLKSKQLHSQYDYLTLIKNIDNITFSPCIYMFQELNELFIIFYQNPVNEENKPNSSVKNGTKKIYIKNNKNKTSRIFL